MRSFLVPALLLIVLPGLYLGVRLGLSRSRWGRWVGGGALALVVLASLPWAGLAIAEIKRLNLLLAGAAALLLLLRSLGVGWTLQARRFDAALAALAVLAVLGYLNFFAFHGARTFVHFHDVAHYYLGSKYYGELGYRDLYTGMLRAEAERHQNHFKAIEARDLATYHRVHIRALLVRSDPVKAAFTPPRWADFQEDVDLFRRRLDAQYGTVLLDHGFNPTPVWALLGGSLSRLVPAGSERGLLLLCLLDPVLLLLSFGAVAWAFGRRVCLLSLLFFCVAFGATFGWTGGAFLRHLWLFGVVVGTCCLHRRRYAAAGVCFALATMVRVFPVVFLLPLVLKAAALVWRRRLLPARYRALFGAFAGTALLLFALTGLLPRGFGHWGEFRANMATHVENISPNLVGLTELLAHRRGGGQVTQAEFDALKVRRQRIYHAQLALVFLPVLVGVGGLGRRRSDLAGLVLALPLLFTGLSLASYYYVWLVLLVLAERESPRHLALLFALEAAAYTLMLFEDREAILFFNRGVLVAFLAVALLLDPVRDRLRARRRRRARRLSAASSTVARVPDPRQPGH